jgi:imidazolonepropionase-like amidohydrolase
MYADLTAPQVRMLSEEAHRQGLQVWSHSVVGPAGADDVIAARVNVMSHAIGLLLPDDWSLETHGSLFVDSSLLGTERLERRLQGMREAGILLDPTLAVFEERLRRLEHSDRVRETRRSLAELMRTVHEHKVGIVAGTDLPLPTTVADPPALFWEMDLLRDWSGMTPIECIQAATLHGARAIGIESTAGSITPGKLADLVILERDPTEDLANLKSIRFTMRHGQIIEPVSERGDEQ